MAQRYLSTDPNEPNEPSTGAVPRRYVSTDPNEVAEESGRVNPWMVGAGTAALAGGAYALTRNPQLAKTAGAAALDLRRLSMLSGLAPLKSLLGNIGGTAYTSIERGSARPLRELFSPRTAREAVATFKAGPSYVSAGPDTAITKLNLPGRFMGALDTATQSALQRAGLTAEEAATTVLQTPLPARLDEGLKHPVMQYLVPFRRTPFNQLIEGGKAFNANTLGKKVALGTAIGSGAVEGTVAEDPKTIALGTAFSGRYGLPHALAAGAARAFRTGSKRAGTEAIQGISPVSDYSLSEGVLGPVVDPTKVIPKPAAIGAYTYLRSLLGLD